MPLNLASPGIVVKEIDLTVGRVTPSSDKIGAIVAPFAKGPVNYPILIENENDLLNNFGEPYQDDKQFEHWLVASSYLAYGGSLNVVRAGGDNLKNARIIGFSSEAVDSDTEITIESDEDYNNLGYNENPLANVFIAAKNPGSWANGIKVAVIDSKSDQTISIGRTDIGQTILNNSILNGSQFNSNPVTIGSSVYQEYSNDILAGIGITTNLGTASLRGVVTQIIQLGSSNQDVDIVTVKIDAIVDSEGNLLRKVDYSPYGVYKFTEGKNIKSGISSAAKWSIRNDSDWFDDQTIEINDNTTLNWNSLAPRPGTSEFASSRGTSNDEVHVVVIDSNGSITGNAGTILEKNLNLSKASDAKFSVGSDSYWRKFLADNSSYIYGLSGPTGITSDFENVLIDPTGDVDNVENWDQPTKDGLAFGCFGSRTLTLENGKNYNGETGIKTSTTNSGPFETDLSDLVSGYDLFQNTEEINVDFLLMGSTAYSKESAQALANKLIQVAEQRKDAIAFISPHRGASLTDTNDKVSVKSSSEDITNNILEFYSAITSSTYAVFDTGHKYMFDRFTNGFKYVPLNGDIAGICARNDINNFPWYSPAGTNRGAILNSVKLAYNPTKSQRDRLYTNRINPVIFSPGSGMVLFGDRTGYAKASAFDRINVRRLFIYLEEAIGRAAKDSLFEFNDELTRTNFVNTVEPFLRDVQAKRGIFDYVVICDETNNTAAVIDSNEFIADIYIKPARSVNFVGLNFIATKTGVDFEEVIGNF
jgi:phage tail sheath protein FI